jgi:hypothetical protein
VQVKPKVAVKEDFQCETLLQQLIAFFVCHVFYQRQTIKTLLGVLIKIFKTVTGCCNAFQIRSADKSTACLTGNA